MYCTKVKKEKDTTHFVRYKLPQHSSADRRAYYTLVILHITNPLYCNT